MVKCEEIHKDTKVVLVSTFRERNWKQEILVVPKGREKDGKMVYMMVAGPFCQQLTWDRENWKTLEVMLKVNK